MTRRGFVAAALVAAVLVSPASASAGILNSLVKHAASSAATKAEKAVVHAIFKDFSRAVRKSQRVRGVRQPAL